ncbi:hypothetical protein OY671_001908 [Metschnikowia pulcherrima]|nr:hypothetical protein OY671_001908 [Metschnikowia pulcherrima]
MSRAHRSGHGATARGRRPRPARTVPGITACGSCAGETSGATDTRPGGQLERSRRIAETGDARSTVVDCLDACERGDVVVVRPVPAARAAGPAWFEQSAGDELTAASHSWIRAGGPGSAPLPDQSAPRAISTQAEVPPPPDAAAAG